MGGAVTGVRPGHLAGAGLALIAVSYGLARFSYGLFVPEFRADFALSSSLLGVVAAGSYIGYCAAILIAGVAVPRFGPRAVAVGAGGMAAAGTALVAGAATAPMLAVGVLLAGTSAAFASPAAAEAVARWTPPRRHESGQAIVNSGTGAGIALSGPVALLALGHWRLAWAAFALIALLVTVWMLLVLPPERRNGRCGIGALREFVGLARDRRSAPMIVATVLFGAASAAVWTFGRDQVVLTSGWGEATSTLLWVVLGGAALTGLATAALVARIGLARSWAAGLASLASATAALGVLPGAGLLAFAAMAVFGAAYVIMTTLVLYWAVRLHPDRTAAAVAVGFLAIAVGQAAATPLAGLLADHAGMTSAFLACAALALGTIVLRPRGSAVRAAGPTPASAG